MTAEKCLEYERTLKGALWANYILIAFVVMVIIGSILFVLWWRKSAKEDAEVFPQHKATKTTTLNWKILLVPVALIVCAVIGALHSTITSISQIHYDLQNKAYIIVDTTFTVTETDWWGRWNSTTYTLSYEKDGTYIEVHPNLKYWELSPGTYTDTVFVYSLKSQIAVDVYPKE